MRAFRLISGLRKLSPEFWVNFAVKAILIGLLAIGAFSGLQQFEGKAFLWRLAIYPIADLIIPVIWTMLGRRPAYPYAADVLLTLPFLIDTAGNARTTPALFGLFSVVTLAADILIEQRGGMAPRTAAWYDKTSPSFADAIALVRRHLWVQQGTFMPSEREHESIKVPRLLYHRMLDTLAYAA